MGDIANLASSEATTKLKEIAEDIRVCMFCTSLGKGPFETRPMSVQEVDEEGNLWFLSSKQSNKNLEIKQDEKVQLVFAKTSDSHFMSVYGTADIYTDKNKIEQQWSPMAKAWFTEGKDDPDLTVIRVRPEDSYYWDTKDGKMISLIKIAAAVVSGKSMDGGIEGRLNI